MNILIIGHARHGKDSVAEILCKNFAMKYESSSHAACRIFLFDKLKDEFGYKTIEECYEGRTSKEMRKRWFDEITKFNEDDPSRLAKAIMTNSNIYCGMRSKRELDKCKEDEVFDVVIGVYRPLFKEEDKGSMELDVFRDSDFVIINSGTLIELEEKVLFLFKNRL